MADTLGIDLAFVACPVDGSGPVIQYQESLLWPGASLYKVLAAVALYRKEEANLSAPVRVGPESRVAGGAGLSLMEDPVTLTWRELMRWMLVGSDNTSAAVIMQHIGEPAVDAVARDAGMTATRIAHSADTVRDAVEATRAATSSVGFSGRDLDDDLIAFAREDRVLGSVTTAEDQVALLRALWSGGLLNQVGTRMVCTMMQQKLSHHRISRTFGYPGVQVAGKTGSWGPFRHDSAVVAHSGEPPVAVSILTRSMDFDRVIPAIDDGIGEIAAMLVDCVRAQTR